MQDGRLSAYRPGADFARALDAQDPLRGLRERFHIPLTADGRESIYLCGNSLGPMPKAVPAAIQQQLDGWARLGVEAHVTPPYDWLPIHETVARQAAALAGAKAGEVVVMGTLTANLHHLMISFYNPTPQRRKILIESNAFPSDRYAAASQIDMIGRKLAPFGGPALSAAHDLIEIAPRPGEVTLREDDIDAAIAAHGDKTALILIGGTNFYTGQTFDMARIVRAGHARGCMVGFDLAHAAGNVKLALHDWGVDFACWCPYKYLNSGPGGIGAIFVHERHHASTTLPRLYGWWSNRARTRFEMRHDLDPYTTAEAWQLSNPPVLSLIPVRVSLDLFMEAGLDRLFVKSRRLTGYLEYLLDSLGGDDFSILTPRDPDRRGAQLSIVVKHKGRAVFESLGRAGVVCDWREPDCIRVAPAPLFNRFADVHAFAAAFAAALGRRLPE